MYALLIGALVVPTTGTLTSCKDYDDDISSLQSQIDKAGLKSDIEALQAQLQNASSAATAAKTAAESALAKAEAAGTADAVAAVKTTADKAAADVATAIANAADAQSKAEDAAGVASTAQAKAEQAISDAADAASKAIDAQGTADQAASDAADALRRIGTLEQNSVTADQLTTKLQELKNSLLGEGGENESIATLTAKVDAYKGAVNELYSAVTSVELVESYAGFSGITNSWGGNSSQGSNLGYWANPLTVNMIHGLITEDSWFGDEVADVDGKKEYKKGTDVSSKDEASIIVRVNPVNADLTKGTKIVLMNSQGESLENFVKVGEPKRFNKLITTRAGEKTGLWQLPLSVADGVSQEAFDEATQVKDEAGNVKHVLYAVAINNTADSKADAAADRYVVSSYDVQPNYKEFEPGNDFTFEVDGKQVSALKNRYNVANYEELKWNGYGPAAEPIMEDNGDIHKNVTTATDDDRSGNNLIQVEVGTKFTVAKIAGLLNDNAVAADYYYVVLDKQNAVESGVSEINAWKSYTIEGLNTVTPASKDLDLIVKSESANGDIIGFRVYAVNKDGKLLDPDGKAFYVQVGNFITGEVIANLDCVKKLTEAKPFTKQAGVTYGEWTVTDKDNIAGSGTLTISDADVKYLDEKGNETTDVSKITQVQFPIDPAKVKDDATITLTSVLKKDGVEVGKVTATITKVLPKTFPAEITFLPKQEITDGSGKFKAYLVPENGWTITTTSDKGSVDLNNIFYDLDDNVTFTIAKAAKNAKNEDIDVTAAKTGAGHHVVNIASAFINSETEHAVTAVYDYGDISCDIDKDTKQLKAKKHTVAYGKTMQVIFACWVRANTYSWAKDKQPKVMWNAEGTVVQGADYDLAHVNVVNNYDAVRFSGTFANLFTKKYFTPVAGSAHLTVNGQVDPYFTVDVAADGKLTFTPSQTENAPTADHVETLEFKVTDAYGHEVLQKFDVTILKPAKK